MLTNKRKTYIILTGVKELQMTLVNADFLKKLGKLDPDLKDVVYPIVEAVQKRCEGSGTRAGSDDLKDIVKRLAKAQERTELRIEELTKVVKDLAETRKA